MALVGVARLVPQIRLRRGAGNFPRSFDARRLVIGGWVVSVGHPTPVPPTLPFGPPLIKPPRYPTVLPVMC